MAQFRATIRGQRGEASRLGSKKSGITAKVNGWTGGVKVFARVDSKGEDAFDVYATNGSSRAGQDVYIGTVNAKGEFSNV
jgi:hypothetical protein